MQRERKIARQPIEQQIENVVVGAEAEREAKHLALCRSGANGDDAVLECRSPPAQMVSANLRYVPALFLGESRIFFGIAIDPPEVKKYAKLTTPVNAKLQRQPT